MICFNCRYLIEEYVQGTHFIVCNNNIIPKKNCPVFEEDFINKKECKFYKEKSKKKEK